MQGQIYVWGKCRHDAAAAGLFSATLTAGDKRLCHIPLVVQPGFDSRQSSTNSTSRLVALIVASLIFV